MASAWTGRAERILGSDGDTYVHGYLALVRSEGAAATGDIDAALRLAERAVDIGSRAVDADLKASALSNLGALKIATGLTFDGFALMEEASIAAVNGELSPVTTGVTACRMIGACRDMTDYRRASEWIEATERYCDRQSLSGFPGVCRVHRAEVVAVGGAWQRAEEELERATTELGAYNATPPQADGFYAIGDIRRLRGDFEGAEQALREAHARGRTPQPALALVRLAEGNIKAAASAINAAVAEDTWDQWARARLLPAQVEIAIAAGDVRTARTAVDLLSEIVADYPSPAFEAGRQVALARVLLAEGDATGCDPGAARPRSRAGARSVRRTRSREPGRSCRAPCARSTTPTAPTSSLKRRSRRSPSSGRGSTSRQPSASDGTSPTAAAGPRRRPKTFMFTDIVGSTSLAEALGDQAWEAVLRKHDDMLRERVAAAGGEVVNSTGDGFFVAFDGARTAIDCAIGIQQELRDLRAKVGFACPVRIGLHSAEANRRGADYSGMGVHVAARVAALAGGGEILATTETIAAAGTVATSEPRTVTVKGVSAPVTFAAISWS